jgi:hypothetical protein
MLRDYRRMDARAEQLVLDYLRRLEDAARGRLGPAERVAFMARSRAAVARQIGETRAAEADDVRRLLRRFGDPDQLAARERQRLDRLGRPASAAQDGIARDGISGTAGAPSGAAEAPGAGQSADPADPPVPAASRRPRRPAPAPAAGPGRPPGAAPALHRPMTARWRPGLRPGQTAAPDGAVEPAPSLRPGSRWARPAPAGPAGPAGVPGTGRDDGQAPAGGWDAAGGEPAAAGPGWLGGLLALVRRHPLECVAIVLIGLGGLIDPWPLWPVGALAMLAAPLWGVRDKLAAVAIPLGFALVGAITLAGFAAHPPGLSGYAHEVHVEGWSLLRAGAVLGAAYLARRVQRGRRPRREPPWRRVPPA